MNATKTQIRGNCQCCGREQAIVRGAIAKHGYVVKDGWFQGVCSGHEFAPLQTDRRTADAVVKQVLEDVVALLIRAEKLENGLIFPELVRQSNVPKAPVVPFAEVSVWKQQEAVKAAVWNAKGRAKAGREFATFLKNLADTIHGTEVRTVTLSGGPAPIPTGEKRESNGRVLTCSYVDGGRVYWKSADGKRNCWTGTAAWRRLPIVA